MTGRGWWTLFCLLLTFTVGLFANFPALTMIGLTLLVWFLWEWLFFAVRVRTLFANLVVERQLRDERGPVTTLWAGRSFTVHVALRLTGLGRLPFVAVSDPVPFGVVHEEGATSADGELRAGAPLEMEYRVHCPLAGLARFEGLRVELSDLHGLFARIAFVRAPIVLRVLPRVLMPRSGGAMTKRHNELPPPGHHRLRQPGSGSELLDLRDYQPGDPPRTIAWKVSAKRDRLVTREYENEVPIRCTLFLDASSSVRLPSPPDEREQKGKPAPTSYRPLDQLVEIAAGAVRASVSMRDLTGLVVFDEHGTRRTAIKRTSVHVTELMQLLAETAGAAPIAARADPEPLAPIAYALVREVYPDLLRQETNRTPFWLTWYAEDAVHSRHSRGMLAALYRRKRSILLWATLYLPFWLFVANVVSLFVDGIPEWVRVLLVNLFVIGTPLLIIGSRVLFNFSLFSNLSGWVLSGLGVTSSVPSVTMAVRRKQLAAIFSARYGPTPGAMQLMMEDDDLYSLYLQRFLTEHQVPFAPPLYDEQGKYLFASTQKIRVLAGALIEATSRGRDNELFVILADLLEFDEQQLDPLLAAVRVALGKHHQVMVVCAWPRGVPLPRSGEVPKPPRREVLGGFMTGLAWERAHVGYARLRRAFSRLGVQVTSAGSEESVPLILGRLQRLRMAGGRR